MTRSAPVPAGSRHTTPDVDADAAPGTEPLLDVLVVGAGITGIYQLYAAREAGFRTRLVEAGSGVGGTWYWNRYPGARFDSESYSYGYLFSKDLFDDWVWQDHFAAQPETERYLNHVVDRFDLRRHMRFDARVTAAVFDEPSGTWTVTLGSDGSLVRARFLVAATGVLSVPYTPDVPGRERFGGVQHHTGRWPSDPVDFRGKRVAVVGTSSSGVQVVPAILDEVNRAVEPVMREARGLQPRFQRLLPCARLAGASGFVAAGDGVPRAPVEHWVSWRPPAAKPRR